MQKGAMLRGKTYHPGRWADAQELAQDLAWAFRLAWHDSALAAGPGVYCSPDAITIDGDGFVLTLQDRRPDWTRASGTLASMPFDLGARLAAVNRYWRGALSRLLYAGAFANTLDREQSRLLCRDVRRALIKGERAYRRNRAAESAYVAARGAARAYELSRQLTTWP